MYKQRNAFTLIELLVVIAIIGLLLAIIVPSLQLAKERAQMVICRASLRSYGLASKQYTTENDDKFPPFSYDSMYLDTVAQADGRPRNCQWHDPEISPEKNPKYAGPMWPYISAQKAHMCPTFKRFAMRYGASHPPYETTQHPADPPIEPQYAFSMNNYLGWIAPKETDVVAPAETLIWVEETIWLIPGWAGWTLNDTCFMSRHNDDTTKWGDFIATYHSTSISNPEGGKGEAVFIDGHVELLDPYKVVDIGGGKQARAGFIHSWPLKGKLSQTKMY